MFVTISSIPQTCILSKLCNFHAVHSRIPNEDITQLPTSIIYMKETPSSGIMLENQK